MSAADEYPWLVEFANSSGLYDASNLGFEADRALNEIDNLRAELVGLRVRTLTAEADAVKAQERANRWALRTTRLVAWIQENCDTAEQIDARRVMAIGVAGETGDTP